MMDKNETFADALAKLKATQDCPSYNKLPKKGEWCGSCRDFCHADGTNWCDRNFYLPKILAVEAAHNQEVAEVIANLDALEKAIKVVCSKDTVDKIVMKKKEFINGER